ncbi:MAG: hypothetical protein HQK75_00025 [Candidatus Magnetomorum sp.]|nr:hypothetical protein [Candidatus Magnetomorum sp.]
MWKDPIVNQVRRVREEHAAKFNFDIKAIIEDARMRQLKSKHKLASFAVTPKTLERDKTA